MESFWNSSNLLKIFMKWKLHIIIITFLGMIIIGASTYLIKPKFKSYAIVYPVNLNQYSDEENSEQMLQILNSRNIKDSIINKYKLAEHYEIDSLYKHFKSTIYDTYNENISVSKTKYDAVEIKVLDTNPDTASLIVNSIIDFYNLKIRSLHNEKYKEAMDIYYNDMLKWKRISDSLKNKIVEIKKEYNIQINTYGEDLFIKQNISKSKLINSNLNYKIKIKNLEKKKENLLNQKGEDFIFLTSSYIDAIDIYNASKTTYENYKRELSKKIKYASVVTEPYPTDIKSSPKRVIITLLGGLSVLILVIFTIGFIENKNKNI